MTPTLSDISTLKPGMKISTGKEILTVVGEFNKYDSVLLTNDDDEYQGCSQEYLSERFYNYGWKLLEEETPYDWKKELRDKFGCDVLGCDEVHYGTIIDIEDFIEEVISKSK